MRESAQVTRTCTYCQKEFTSTRSRVAAGRGKICTRKCQERHESAIHPLICKGCGKTFLVYPSEVKYRKYCTTACMRNPLTLPPPTDLELAYIAGLLDGEGSISVAKQQGSRALVPSYGLDVQITNTHAPTLQWLRDSVGGTICWNRRKEGQHRLDCGVWKISRPRAAAFLRLVLPHLRIKREQAEVALAFQAHADSYREGNPFRGIDANEAVIREGFRERLSALKGPYAPRGRASTPRPPFGPS